MKDECKYNYIHVTSDIKIFSKVVRKKNPTLYSKNRCIKNLEDYLNKTIHQHQKSKTSLTGGSGEYGKGFYSRKKTKLTP